MCLTRPISTLDITNWILLDTLETTERLMANCDSDDWESDGAYMYYMDKLKLAWEEAKYHLHGRADGRGCLIVAQMLGERYWEMRKTNFTHLRAGDGKLLTGHMIIQYQENEAKKEMSADPNCDVIAVLAYFIRCCDVYGDRQFIREVMKTHTELGGDSLAELLPACFKAEGLEKTTKNLFNSKHQKVFVCPDTGEHFIWSMTKWSGLFTLMSMGDIEAGRSNTNQKLAVQRV